MGKVNTETHVGQSKEKSKCSVLNSDKAIRITVNLSVKRKVVSRCRRSQGTRKGSESECYYSTIYTHRKLSKLTKGARNQHLILYLIANFISKEDGIEEVREIHKGRYDYNKQKCWLSRQLVVTLSLSPFLHFSPFLPHFAFSHL